MSAVFLGTVELLALWDADDQSHALADQAYRRLLRSADALVTTSYVLPECGYAAARRPYRVRVPVLRSYLAD
jgi:predicted nucleic acid-binding protein